MVTKKYDAVIIGAGTAGLAVGAILAAKEHKKVLVMEREEHVGGRLVSFVGKENAISLLDKELDARGFEAALRAVNTWLVRSKPGLPTMIKRGLLDGYTFEAGVHATFWGNKGRAACLLDYLGKHTELPGNEGYAIVDPKDNKWHRVEKRGKYGWMTDEADKETKRLLREMASVPLKEAEKYELMSFGQWLKGRTSNRQAYEYLKALCSIHMSISEPDMQPFGDFLRFMMIAKDIGMDLVTGSTGTGPRPGLIQIAVRLAEALRDNDGEIMLGTPVEEVIIEDRKAKGVTVQTKGGLKRIEAGSVVCTVPVKGILKVIPERHFPSNFVKKINERFWNIGMLSAYIGLKRNIIEDKDVNPKSWLVVPALIREEEGYTGDVDIVMFMSSNWTNRAPAGKHLWEFSIALLGEELRDKKKVNRVIDAVTAFMQRNFPTWGDDVDWQLWTASQGFGPCAPIGERRPDVKCPWVDGLYFAGDGYGVRRWGVGIDGAVQSAVLCVDSMTGKNYLSEILPAYHR